MPTNVEVAGLGVQLLMLASLCFFLLYQCKHIIQNRLIRWLVVSILCGCGLFMSLGFTITIGHLIGFWEMTK